jgi:hypothetical protein
MEKVYWRTKDGKYVDIDAMDINHLRNTLKMIVRNNQRVQSTCPHNIEQAIEHVGYEKKTEMFNKKKHYL